MSGIINLNRRIDIKECEETLERLEEEMLLFFNEERDWRKAVELHNSPRNTWPKTLYYNREIIYAENHSKEDCLAMANYLDSKLNELDVIHKDVSKKLDALKWNIGV